MDERTHRDLVESGELYRMIFNTAPLGIIHFDRNGTVTECNGHFLEIMGARRDSVLGFNVFTGIRDEKMRSAALSALSGVPGRFEGDYLSVTGNKLTPVRACYRRIKAEDGTLLGAVGIFEDISECRQAEEALRREVSFRETVIRNLGEGLCVCHELDHFPFLEFTIWNERMVDITGYSMEEINDLGMFMCFCPEPAWRHRTIARIRAAMAGRNLVGREWEIIRADGEKRTLCITTSILEPDDGSRHLLVLMEDITGAKAAAEELDRYRQHLEISVAEQTSELRKTNQLLQLEMSERKRANQALEKTNRRLMDIIDFLPDATFVIDRRKRIIAWNRAIEEMTGVGKDEVLGKGDHAYAVPFYGVKRPILIDMLMEPGTGDEKHYSVVERRDHSILGEAFVPKLYGNKGAYLWSATSLLFDQEGNVTGAIQSIRDISQRRKAEQRLRASEERFQTIFDSAQDCIYLKDCSFKYRLVNPAMARLFGLPASELIGKSAREVYGEEAGRIIEEYDKRVFAGKIIEKENTRPVRGESRTFHVIKVPVRDHAGEIAGLCGIVRDITERKQIERELQNALKFLQVLIDTIPAPIFYKDEKGVYLGCNSAFEACFGRRREDIIGKSVFDVAPEKAAAIFDSMDRALFESSGGVQVFETPLSFADGKVHDVLFSKSTFLDISGVPAGIVGVMIDISELKRAEERFRQAVELSPFPISIVDANGKYLYLNKKFTQLFGYTLDDIPTRREWFLKAFPDHELRRQALACRRADLSEPAGRQIAPRLFSIRCKSGKMRDVLFRPAVMEDGLQFVTYEDLTELKTAQLTLLKSEQRYQLLFEYSPLGVIHFDENGTIIDCNKRLPEMFGTTREEVIGFNLLEDLRNEEMRSAVCSALTTGFCAYEGDYFTEAGDKLLSIQAYLGSIQSEDGEFWGALCIIDDVSEKKMTEINLKESERKFRLMAESIHDVFWTGTPDFEKMLYVNPSYERMWGRSRQSLYDNPLSFFDSIHPEDRERILGKVRNLSGEQTVFDEEYRIVEPDGSVRWIRNRAFPIRDDRDEIHLITGLARDITGRKLSEEALRQSESELRFLSSRLLSAQEEERKRLAGELHDSLASSLTAIKVGLETARHRLVLNKVDPAVLETPIYLTRLAIDEVRSIIMDLRPTVLDDLGLIATLDWTCRQFGAICPNLLIEKRIDVEEDDIPEELKTVIFRVVQECFHNISKHSEADRVTLSLLRDEHVLELIMEDNGAGFDLNSALAREDGMRGLGLTSMKERVELSGGSFAIRSGFGLGTEIRASWPMRPRAAYLIRTGTVN